MKTRLVNCISIQIKPITLILIKAREVAIMANSNLIIDSRESRILLSWMVIMVLSRIQKIRLRKAIKVMVRQYKDRMHKAHRLGSQRLSMCQGLNLPRMLARRQNSKAHRIQSTKLRWEARNNQATALAANNLVKMESNRRHSHRAELYSMNMAKMER